VSRTLAFKSRLLLLEVLEVEVLEILHRLTLYSMIGRLETSDTRKINQTEHQQRNINNMMQWLDRFYRYETFGAKIT
jgi:hypothetical protein